MKFKVRNIDFTNIKTIDDLHDTLFDIFGFPDFYGRNIHALIDCLSSIKYPEEGMTSFFLDQDEVLVIRTLKASEAEEKIIVYLVHAIECLNEREQLKNQQDLIYLVPG